MLRVRVDTDDVAGLQRPHVVVVDDAHDEQPLRACAGEGHRQLVADADPVRGGDVGRQHDAASGQLIE
jgi:hypothetical protein